MENQKMLFSSQNVHQDLQIIQICPFQNASPFTKQNKSKFNRANTLVGQLLPHQNFKKTNKRKNQNQSQRNHNQSFQVANPDAFIKNIKKNKLMENEGNGRLKLSPIKKYNLSKPKLIGAKKCIIPYIEQIRQNQDPLIIKICNIKNQSDENNEIKNTTLVAVKLNQEQIKENQQIIQSVKTNQKNQNIEQKQDKVQAFQNFIQNNKQNIQNPIIQQQFQLFDQEQIEKRKDPQIHIFSVKKEEINLGQKKELYNYSGVKKISLNIIQNLEKKSQSLYLPRILQKSTIQPMFFNVEQPKDSNPKLNSYKNLKNNQKIKNQLAKKQVLKEIIRKQKIKQASIGRKKTKEEKSLILMNLQKQKISNKKIQSSQECNINKNDKLKNFNHKNFQSQLAEVESLTCLITESCISKKQYSLDKKQQSKFDCLQENQPILKMSKSHRDQIIDQEFESQAYNFRHQKIKTNFQPKQSFYLSYLLSIPQSLSSYGKRQTKQDLQSSFHLKSTQSSKKNYANLGQYFLNKQSSSSTLHTESVHSFFKKQQKSQDQIYKNFQASDLLQIIQNRSHFKLKTEKQNLNEEKYQQHRKRPSSPKSICNKIQYLYQNQGQSLNNLIFKNYFTDTNNSPLKLKKESCSIFQNLR